MNKSNTPEYRRKYYEANKEKFKAKFKQYHIDHAAVLIARTREWAKNNPERLREYQLKYAKINPDRFKDYYRANRESIKVKNKAYYQANKERINAKKQIWSLKQKALNAPEAIAAIGARIEAKRLKAKESK